MREIDPTIRQVAEIYGFTIEVCDVLKKTIIKHEENHCSFFWDTSYSDQNFWDALKDFFADVGAQSEYWN